MEPCQEDQERLGKIPTGLGPAVWRASNSVGTSGEDPAGRGHRSAWSGQDNCSLAVQRRGTAPSTRLADGHRDGRSRCGRCRRQCPAQGLKRRHRLFKHLAKPDQLGHLRAIITVGRTSLAGAEGATAPETLRQTDRRGIEDSGERRGQAHTEGIAISGARTEGASRAKAVSRCVDVVPQDPA